MTSLSEVLVYINPIFFYYSGIFGIGKLYQWIFAAESIWQCLWDKVMDIFGENRETYSVWIINSYSYVLYWLFGSILLFIKVYNKPKTVEIFKIQQESGLERFKNIQKVRNVRIKLWIIYELLTKVDRENDLKGLRLKCQIENMTKNEKLDEKLDEKPISN